MDLTNVKTVQDLINLDIGTEMENQSVSGVMDGIMKLTPAEGKELPEVLETQDRMHNSGVDDTFKMEMLR